ncbi:MAG: MFS transporter, partial [Mycobacteriaceae bacterium]|nr:MFS transporter [Mycobacteriaceae bacterium]
MDTAVRFSEARGRWVLAAAVLGSGMAMLDGTVVNVALPRLADEFGASVAGLQWTVNAYALTLAGFILLGGALGDRYGRRRVFTIGVVWFAVASAICGFAPDIEILIAARALQGVGGALLMPGSLAILQATFVAEDRARAVGAWSGLGGVAGAVGPFLGGWLVESVSWRWVFLLNLPLAAVVIAIAVRHVPETQDPQAHGRFDILGGTLAAIGLAGITYALTALPDGGSAGVVAGIAGLAAAALFGAVEWHRTQRDSETPAMLPLDIFRSSQFSAINAVTFLVYGAMSVLFFLLVVDLQVVAGFSPITAGTALLPV